MRETKDRLSILASFLPEFFITTESTTSPYWEKYAFNVSFRDHKQADRLQEIKGRNRRIKCHPITRNDTKINRREVKRDVVPNAKPPTKILLPDKRR